MKKRVVAAMLWLFAFWYLGATISLFANISPALGPILGTAAAALVAGDPRHLIWTRVATGTSRDSKSSGAAPTPSVANREDSRTPA